MSNILEFRSASDRNDAEIEAGLREGLASHGFSKDAVDAAVSIAMPLFQESKSVLGGSLSFSLSSALNEDQVKDLESKISEVFQKHQYNVSHFIQKLIVRVALLEARSRSV